MKKLLGFASSLLLASAIAAFTILPAFTPFASVQAQVAPPTYGGTQTLTVTSTTGSVTLPSTASNYLGGILLLNDGAIELFWTAGAAAVATTSAPLSPGQQVCINPGLSTTLAAITVAGSTTLRVTPVSQCPSFQQTVFSSAVPLSPYPVGATPETISATGTTAAVTGTLATGVGKTTYICGFTINSSATAGIVVSATVTGVITGTLTFSQGVGIAPAVVSTQQSFYPCVPASTTNTVIAVVSGAASTGGVTSVIAWGYQL